jgi:asparagine synthetase B (glutamine-hydrolysing)
MCGIAGALVLENGHPDLELFWEAVAACRQRGIDSFGMVRWSRQDGWREIHGIDLPLPECRKAMERGPEDGPVFFLHSSRAEPTTEWRSVKTEKDMPPFRGGSFAVAHNGIIANDAELTGKYGVEKSSPIDTAVLPGLAGKIGVRGMFSAIRGGSALAVIDAAAGVLSLGRNFMPLSIVWNPGLVVFASEGRFFPGFGSPFAPFHTWDLPPYSVLELSARGFRGPMSFEAPEPSPTAWLPYPWQQPGLKKGPA